MTIRSMRHISTGVLIIALLLGTRHASAKDPGGIDAGITHTEPDTVVKETLTAPPPSVLAGYTLTSPLVTGAKMEHGVTASTLIGLPTQYLSIRLGLYAAWSTCSWEHPAGSATLHRLAIGGTLDVTAPIWGHLALFAALHVAYQWLTEAPHGVTGFEGASPEIGISGGLQIAFAGNLVVRLAMEAETTMVYYPGGDKETIVQLGGLVSMGYVF